MKYEPVAVPSKTKARSLAPRPPQPNKKLPNIKKQLEEARKGKIKFPVHAFPDRIQNIINVFHDCYRLPIDYHAASILAATSVAVGNAYVAHYKRGQIYPAILYIGIVGFPSSGKSPGIDFGVYPLFRHEEKLRDEHSEALQKWEEICWKNKLNGNSDQDPPKPRSKDIIINDATVESINLILQNNPKGVLYYQDELKAWINSMNSYRKGSDLEFFLSMWSGKSGKITRSGKDSVFIRHPFLTVIGGIQPGVLRDLANNGKSDNGFLARILFAYPDDMDCPKESDQEPDGSVYRLYDGLIDFLFRLPNRIEMNEHDKYKRPVISRIEVPLAIDAKKRYISFLDEYSKEMNESEEEVVKGILGKLKQYCLRIALLLEMLELACRQAPPMKEGWPNKKVDIFWDEVNQEDMENLTISLKSLENAILMTEYFRSTAFKVVDRLDSPVNALPAQKKFLYKQLPEEFDRIEVNRMIDLINKEDQGFKMSERTIYRFLNDKTLFTKMMRGRYQKNHLY